MEMIEVYDDKDVRAPLTVAENLHAALSGSALVVLPDAGHLCNIEAPEEFNRVVRNYLLDSRSHAGVRVLRLLAKGLTNRQIADQLLLRVPSKRRKRQRLGDSTAPARLRAERPNQVWALEFQFDTTVDGRVLKPLHVVDEHNAPSARYPGRAPDRCRPHRLGARPDRPGAVARPN